MSSSLKIVVSHSSRDAAVIFQIVLIQVSVCFAPAALSAVVQLTRASWSLHLSDDNETVPSKTYTRTWIFPGKMHNNLYKILNVQYQGHRC